MPTTNTTSAACGNSWHCLAAAVWHCHCSNTNNAASWLFHLPPTTARIPSMPLVDCFWGKETLPQKQWLCNKAKVTNTTGCMMLPPQQHCHKECRLIVYFLHKNTATNTASWFLPDAASKAINPAASQCQQCPLDMWHQNKTMKETMPPLPPVYWFSFFGQNVATDALPALSKMPWHKENVPVQRKMPQHKQRQMQLTMLLLETQSTMPTAWWKIHLCNTNCSCQSHSMKKNVVNVQCHGKTHNTTAKRKILQHKKKCNW